MQVIIHLMVIAVLDITDYYQVSSCEVCQKNNYKLWKPSGTLHPIPVIPKIWHQVGMDLIGPLTETNKYIMTITDYFFKWAEAGPLPVKSVKGIAKFIYSNVKLHYVKKESLCFITIILILCK